MRRHLGLGLLALIAALVAACALSEPNPNTAPTSTNSPAGTQDDTEQMRGLAFTYWDAFNAYDKERTLSYLEEEYRAAREETVRSEIGRLKLFRVKLGLSEESPPQFTGPDEGEMFLTMKEPLGTRRIHMAFRKVDGEWKITYAEEAK